MVEYFETGNLLMVGNQEMKRTFLVASFYTLLSIVVTWPLILNLNTLVIDPYDALLNTWMLNWTAHSFAGGLSGLLNYYNANIFFPYTNTFAFSDLQTPLGILAIPFIYFSKEPLWANNIITILGFVLSGLSVYWLTRLFVKKNSVALLSGIIFSFSCLHLNYIAHQQAFHFWPVVLCIYFLFRKSSIWFSLFFLTASLTYVYNFYVLLLIGGIYFVYFPSDRIKTFLGLVLGIIVTTPFLIPFLLVSKEFNYVRPINDVIHFSLHPLDIFNIGSNSRLNFIPYHPNNATAGFFGVVTFCSIIVMFWQLWFFRKALPTMENSRTLIFFLILAVFAFIMAIGPGVHLFRETVHVGPLPIIPGPYLIFYFLVPGFKGFRTPSRWIIVTFFAFILALAIYFAKRITWKVTAVLIIVTLLELSLPLRYSRVPSVSEFPPEQSWLVNNFKGAPIIEFPIYVWSDRTTPDIRGNQKLQTRTNGVGEETLREYYSTIHWHPMYNGYSGFSPKSWERDVQWLQKEFPSQESVSYLKNKGIKLILVPSSWQPGMEKFKQLKLIKRFSNTFIYRIL